MLTLKNFYFSFGDKDVLQDISFSLPSGAYLSIIGPNGAGKSTLLKCIMRVHEYGTSRGKIRIAGQDINKYSQKELARLVSYVPQAGGWIPPFTVKNFLLLSRFAYNTFNKTDSCGSTAVDRALHLTGLRSFAERPLRELSGGERQKAFLAAALAQGAEIMLLDEPDAFLDPKHSSEINALLLTLNRELRLTILAVTHNLNRPLAAAGQALLLREGRQLYYGPSTGLIENNILEQAYQHKFIYCDHPVTGSPMILTD